MKKMIKKLLIIIIIIFVSPLMARSEELKCFGSLDCSLGKAFEIGKTKIKRWQRKPAIAFDGQETYMAVWQEGSQQCDLYGVRIDKKGNILDPGPFPVCREEGIQRDPQIVYGGDVFLVVWSDSRSQRDYDLYGARVSSDGHVLDEDGFPISTGRGNRVWPALTSNGKTFIVVWSDFRNRLDYDLYLTQINPKGRVDRSREILVSGRSRGTEGASLIHEVAPSIAWDGREFWVAWLESFHHSIYSHRNRTLKANIQIYDKELKNRKIKGNTAIYTGKRSRVPLAKIYCLAGEYPQYLFTYVRYHYQKSVSYLALSYIDPLNMNIIHFEPYIPSEKEKRNWLNLLNFNPDSNAMDKWYFQDTESGPLSYAYLMAPEAHKNRWAGARGGHYLFVVTEFKKGLKQGLRGWVLREGLRSSPLTMPGFQVDESFISASPAVAADGAGGAFLVYEADRGVDDCVIIGRLILPNVFDHGNRNDINQK